MSLTSDSQIYMTHLALQMLAQFMCRFFLLMNTLLKLPEHHSTSIYIHFVKQIKINGSLELMSYSAKNLLHGCKNEER